MVTETQIQEMPKNTRFTKGLMALFLLIAVTGLGTGCSKKKVGGKTNGYRYSRTNVPNNALTDPRTGQVITSEWGTIFSSGGSFNSAMRSFMPGVSDLGYISANPGDATGLRFRGRVSSGIFEIMVWDEVASQTGKVYFWQMRVADVQDEGGNIRTVYLEDTIGDVALQGEIMSNGEWAGYVYYRNAIDGQTQNQNWIQLGNFRIAQNPTLN